MYTENNKRQFTFLCDFIKVILSQAKAAVFAIKEQKQRYYELKQKRGTGFAPSLFFVSSLEIYRLHETGIHEEMTQNTGHITEDNGRHPFQMDTERIFAPGRPHQRNSGR